MNNVRRLIQYWLFGTLLSLFPAQAWADNKSGVEPHVISLPKGPGSIEGLGESFEPQLNTGTATYRVKIAMSPGINKHQPEVVLEYNSGYGNSVVGLGWELNNSFIQRRTDKGLPDYTDNDRFAYSRNGEIVPLADGSHRLKVEGLFIKFQKSGDSWEAWEKNGTHLFFGSDVTGRLTTQHGTFRWLLQKSVDTNGNEIRYFYTHDSGQVYLTEIRYSIMSDTIYKSVQFGYEPRPDAFADYHSRSRVLTTQRLKTVDVKSQGELVRVYELAYLPDAELSLLSQVVQRGADGNSSLPPLTFDYSTYDPEHTTTAAMSNPPPVMVSLKNPDVDLIDINGDSLPDMVYTEKGVIHHFYLNNGNGTWEAQEVVPEISPQHLLSSRGVMMADMDGDGLADLFVKTASDFGYFKNRGALNWEASDWTPCAPNPSFSFKDEKIKLLDMNNDGLIDVLYDTGSSYYVWLNRKGNTWSSQFDYNTRLPDGDHLRFANADGTPNVHVRLADMNGDRMEDLVYISDGLVVYYPNMGLGQFDDRIVIANPPAGLGSLASRLEVADINNDGFADLVLVGSGGNKVWFNAGNGSFKPSVTFSGTPTYNEDDTAYRFADMNGDGLRDLLITSGSSTPRFQYVDFTSGAHPNILTKISNGLGQETTISYKSSSDDYIADRDKGAPWTTMLPFAVQVVSRVAVNDLNSGQVYVTDYFYRDGYYDGMEKEFRGFGRVTKLERGDASAPTLCTEYTFDVGREEISRKGMVKNAAVLTGSGTIEPPVGLFDVQDNTLETRTLFTGTNGEAVAFSFIKVQNVWLYESTAPAVHLSREFNQDDYGNTTKDYNYGIVSGTDKAVGKDEILTTTGYLYDETNWIVDRPETVSKTDLTGKFVSLQRNFYDPKGNLIRQESSPDGTTFIKVVRNDFDGHGNIYKITDANDHWRQIDYDTTFHTFPVKETIGGLNLSISAEYNYGLGVVTSFTDFNSNRTTFGYDPLGRLTAIVKPGDSKGLPTQTFDYALASPVSSITTRSREVSGQSGTYDSIAYFDGLGRKLQTRSEGHQGLWVVADAVIFNQRKGIYWKWFPYFASTSSYKAPDQAQPYTAFIYDAKGRSVKETNPDTSFRSTVYQPLTKILYDEEDNTPTSPHTNTPHTFINDGLERLVEVRERHGAATYTTRYEYDGLNNLTKITDNEENVKTMRFDGLGRKTNMFDPDKHEMSYIYDPAGNLLSTTDAKKQTVSYTHDEANRILTESFSGVKVRHHYDADLPPAWPGLANTKGKLAWMEDEAGKEYYSYDSRGNAAMKIREAGGLTFINRMGYDAMDRLTSFTYPDGFTLGYRYNAMNLLDSIPGFVSAIDYMPTGQKGAFRYANGVASTYKYDPRQRLTNLKSMAGARTLQDLSYGYDTVGNVTSITDNRATRVLEDLTRSFQYDDLYRLTEARATAAGWLESYQYNSIGNMTFKSDIGIMMYGSNGAGPHALTRAADANIEYGYDANGNIASKTPGFTYQFDHRDRLKNVQRTTDGAAISYSYDYKGNRVAKSITSGATAATTIYADKYTEVRGSRLIKQVFAGDRLVARVSTPFSARSLITRTRALTENEFDIGPKDGVITLAEIKAQGVTPGSLDSLTMADALRIHYENRELRPSLLPFATAAQALHEMKAAPPSMGTVDFYLPDHLGSASIVTDATGTVVEESVFYPYGKDRTRSGSYKSEYRFTGKELDDETGLHYFGARYYDSVTGRFVNVDPMFVEEFKDATEKSNFTNTYRYCANNPLNFIDKNGLAEIGTDEWNQDFVRAAKDDRAKFQSMKKQYDVWYNNGGPQAAAEIAYQNEMIKGYDRTISIVKPIKGAADLGVDVLSRFTGPAGKAIDVGYGMTNDFVESIGNNNKSADPNNAKKTAANIVIGGIGSALQHSVESVSGLSGAEKIISKGIVDYALTKPMKWAFDNMLSE